MISAVMFDFSGTLFRGTDAETWLRGALDEFGLDLGPDELRELAARLDAAGAPPGGHAPANLPAELAGAWERRDLDPAAHRAAYTGLARTAQLPDDRLAEVLYDRRISTEAWSAYPDTASTLKELRRRSVPVAVVSNIAWDIREIFAAHGVYELVDEYVLSYEIGVQKPDPAIFETALAALGRTPAETVMVGDNTYADGGASALGCTFRHVEPLPVAERPTALAGVLSLLG